MTKIELAKKIATEAHEGQTRWDGTPYITHPKGVVEILVSWCVPEEHLVVGWLHDVVEDTEVTLQELRDKGFNEEVIEAIEAITHRENESYARYITRVANNPIANQVKRADLRHNLSDLKDGQRKEKYELAALYLERVYNDILYGHL